MILITHSLHLLLADIFAVTLFKWKLFLDGCGTTYIYPVVTGTGGNSNTTATTAAGVVFADDGGAGVTGGTQQVAAYRIDSKTFVMNLTAGQEVRMGIRGEMTANIKGATETQWTMQLLG